MPSPSCEKRSMKPLLTALQRLVEGDVEFIVVGGLACVIQGAPVMTFDVDIVHARTVPNVQRLLTALSGMNGRYRVRPDLTPSAEALLGPGHHLMQTDHGPLDVLGALQGAIWGGTGMPLGSSIAAWKR